MEEPLARAKHVRYFKRCLALLPPQVQELDTSRMTLAFFALSGLDLLGALGEVEHMKTDIIDWIYAQQILPDKDNPDMNLRCCGFRGGSFGGVPFNASESPKAFPYDRSHVAMTYSALTCLLILGDDLSRVNRRAVIEGLKSLQNEDGSFSFATDGEESDMRFVFCACCVCYILKDWSGVDKEKIKGYIRRSKGYDYGFGQGPYLESHGGSTFCAVASLVLMGQLENTFTLEEQEKIREWCLRRQQTGFNGRPNKDVDTCYSFWVGATLELLGCKDYINWTYVREFVMSTEGSVTGGFGKSPDAHPDPMHSYLGLCGLSIGGEADLIPLFSALNISKRTKEWLTKIHEQRLM